MSAHAPRLLEPARRIRRWRSYLVVWTLHRTLGLFAAAALLLLSVTGSVLVVHHDIERWLGAPYVIDRAQAAGDATTPATLRAAFESAAAAAPAEARPFRLMLPKADDESVKVIFLDAAGDRWSAFVHPLTTEVLWAGPDIELFTPWLLGLHMHLHLPPWGYAITGVFGLALVLLGLSGLYLHRHDLEWLWRRPPVRLGRGWRVALRDLHTWVGTLSLYFSIVLGATGLAFAMLIMPGQLNKQPPPAAVPVAGPAVAFEPLLAQALARLPGHEVLRISFPATPEAPLRLLLLDRRAPVWAKFSTADFDAHTGELMAARSGRDATARQKWRALVGPLHFGFYGAPWVKVAYVIGGLAPGLLATTGVLIWWRRTRRRDVSRPLVRSARSELPANVTTR